MKIYLFRIDDDALQAQAGTWLFSQDGMYYYKTITEQERWLSIEAVENDASLFREVTALEQIFHVKEKL